MIESKDLNYYGKSIGTIIIFLIFIIGLIIIIDEFYNLTKFCYRYTYLYNFGNINEETCKRDNNNVIEYETARFRIYNELTKYKFHRDLFNKTWLNYLIVITILFLTLMICIVFGYLFHHLFIQFNSSCSFNKEDFKNETKKSEISFLNLLLYCLQGDNATFLPNCTFNYIILFIIIIIYPVLYLMKFFLKIDYTTTNNSFYIKTFHLAVFISIIYYEYILFINKGDNNPEEAYYKMGIYFIFIIVFYLADNIFNKTFDDYSSLSKVVNIYKNDINDINFFDIYKQQEPIKPIEPVKPPTLDNFKYCKTEDFNNENDSYCYNLILPKNSAITQPTTLAQATAIIANGTITSINLTNNGAGYVQEKTFVFIKGDGVGAKATAVITTDGGVSSITINNGGKNYKTIPKIEIKHINKDYLINYTNDKNKYDNYIREKEEYKKDIKIYNTKYNIYKNNLIEFPNGLYIFKNILPNLLGINKTNIQILFIILIIISVIIYLLNKYNQNKYADYIYFTIYIYIIAILTLLILSNAVLTYNTYINKYLIYEPTAYYKEDFNNTNAIFSALLIKDINKMKANNFINYYNILNDKSVKLFETPNDITKINYDNINNYITEKSNTPLRNDTNTNPNISSYPEINKLIININRLIYSYIIKIPYNKEFDFTLITDFSNFIGNMSDISIKPDTTNIIDNINTNFSSGFRTFLIIIKTLFLEDKSKINNVINEMEDVLMRMIYTNDTNNITLTNKDFYKIFLNLNKYKYKDIDISKETTELIEIYKYNNIIISKILEVFKNLILTFRTNVVYLLNITDNYCNEDEIINIDLKLNQFMKKIFVSVKYNFNESNYNLSYNIKTSTQESKINIYKRSIDNNIRRINLSLIKHLNAIKYLMSFISPNLDEPNSLDKVIINNYNFFNSDNKKHIDNKFLTKSLKIYNSYKNNYHLYKNNNLEELNNSINNISWSFTILIIIFAVVLLEPTIV